MPRFNQCPSLSAFPGNFRDRFWKGAIFWFFVVDQKTTKRAHLLIHQSARLPSPAFMVTRVDALIFPVLRVPVNYGNGSSPWRQKHAMEQYWDMEAVAAYGQEWLTQPPNVNSALLELVRQSGISSWAPAINRSITTTFKTWEAHNETLTEDRRAGNKMSETHWLPINAESLQLQHWMRTYPHLQDTGGFVVAVLEREPRQKSHISVAAKRDVEDAEITVPEAKKVKLDLGGLPEPQQNVRAASDTKKATFKGKPKFSDPSFKEMPYTFLEPNDPTLLSCIEQLNLTASFPSSNVLIRNPEGDVVRSFYLTNDLVKAVIPNNDYIRMRLMMSGTKVITEQEAGRGLEAQFRVLSEGLPFVLS
ncbi:hypothetical protein EDB19DRAFT_1954364 [Suillus lakei]|nr:hypothetical protein EDB19DRAFT_1954364 [Suillus lakei]